MRAEGDAGLCDEHHRRIHAMEQIDGNRLVLEHDPAAAAPSLRNIRWDMDMQISDELLIGPAVADRGPNIDPHRPEPDCSRVRNPGLASWRTPGQITSPEPL